MSDLSNRLLKGGVWALSVRLIAALSVFLIGALVTRLLSPEDAGIYYLAASIVAFGATVAQLGLHQATVQLIAESLSTHSKDRARSVVRMSCQVGLAGAGLVGLSIFFAGRPLALRLFGSKGLASVSGPVALWVAALALQTLVARIFLGFQNIKLSSWLEGTVANLLCLATFVVIWFASGHATVSALVVWSSATAVLAALAAAALLVPQLELSHIRDRGTSVKEVIHAAWPVFVMTVAARFVEQSYLWIVGIVRPAQEVAIFAVSWRLVNLVALPLIVINAVIPPFITELHVQRRRAELQSMLRLSAAIAGVPALIVLIAFVAFPAMILGAAYGDFYRCGASVLLLLAVGQIVNVWSGSCALALLMIGKQRLTMIVSVVCGVVPLPLAVFVGRHSGIGAVAAVFALGTILQNVAMVVGVRLVAGVWTQLDLASLSRLPALIRPVCHDMAAILWSES